MATRLELPALGNSMEEGTITRWFKAEGEEVQKGEALYEVMTDKVNMEVESPTSGTLRKILADADATVPVNAPVAILGAPDEDISALLGGPPPEASPVPNSVEDGAEDRRLPTLMPSLRDAGDAPGRVFASPRARRYADECGVDITLLAGRGTGVDGRVVEADVVAFYEEQQAQRKAQRVSPLAARVAAAHGVPVAEVPGSGPRGKVTHEDVRRVVQPELVAVEALQAAPLLSVPAEEEATVIKLTGMRKMVADAVARSAQTAPHVTLTLAADMGEATRFRQQVLPAIEKTHGVRVSFTDIIAKAAARTLQDQPYLNSTLNGSEITLHKRVHLGVAVSLGTEGLIVPVVKDAQAKSLGEFSAALKGLVAKAKEGKLASDEVTGGTFSLTNLGTFGITQFNPIINPPQAAILGVCAIQDTIVPVDGQPQVRPMMNLCLSFDHRVTDGAPAAAFLARLKEILEQPYLMFA
ncbi:MAG: 2-oxo acid dehydrogenase subunit E2 [Armatimonadetes bacterium]|nr:2-oxo acid dehydrogenase subunit E2 [Armatimonadota bacterium]